MKSASLFAAKVGREALHLIDITPAATPNLEELRQRRQPQREHGDSVILTL